MTLKKLLSFCTAFLVSLQFVNTAAADDYSDTLALVDQSAIVFKKFCDDPEMVWFQDNMAYAKAVFIVPQMIKAGLIVGGSGGSGVLLSRNTKQNTWSYPVFYRIGSISFGLQIGGEVSQVILMVMTDKGMNSMLTTSFKLGADASVAAGPVGIGAKAATADILAFARSQGAFMGLAVEGAIITPENKRNQAYYTKQVSPADIILRELASNPHAAPLRQSVAEQSKLKTTKVVY